MGFLGLDFLEHDCPVLLETTNKLMEKVVTSFFWSNNYSGGAADRTGKTTTGIAIGER